MSSEDVTVENVAEDGGGRFEARVAGAVAGSAHYERHGDRVVFTHTEVDDSHEGQGVGSALIRRSLDTVRASDERAVPLCPFVSGYIERHDEYPALVDHDMLARLSR